MSKVAWREVWRQFCQHAVGGYAWNLPPLIQVRIALYRAVFHTGRNCSYAHHVSLECHHGLPGTLRVGDCVQLGHHVTIDYSGNVVLEDHVWISEGTLVFTHDHRFPGPGLKVETEELITRPLVIERDAWIGADALILPQVGRIGCGAIVGAGSVVTKPVAPFTIVAGNPAKVIGERPHG